MSNEKTYPFKEGDDYWTVSKGTLTWSCWDDISEEIHDEYPDRVYFTGDEVLDIAKVRSVTFIDRKLNLNYNEINHISLSRRSRKGIKKHNQ